MAIALLVVAVCLGGSQEAADSRAVLTAARDLITAGKARDAVSKLETLDRSAPEVAHLLGAAYYHADDYQRAIELLASVRERLPAEDGVHSGLGRRRIEPVEAHGGAAGVEVDRPLGPPRLEQGAEGADVESFDLSRTSVTVRTSLDRDAAEAASTICAEMRRYLAQEPSSNSAATVTVVGDGDAVITRC